MIVGRILDSPKIVPTASGGRNTPPGPQRRVRIALVVPASPESPNPRLTTPGQAARIPRWPVRRPMASPCVTGEQRKGLYVSDSDSVDVGVGMLGSRRIGVCREAVAVQRDGAGYVARSQPAVARGV